MPGENDLIRINEIAAEQLRTIMSIANQLGLTPSTIVTFTNIGGVVTQTTVRIRRQSDRQRMN